VGERLLQIDIRYSLFTAQRAQRKGNTHSESAALMRFLPFDTLSASGGFDIYPPFLWRIRFLPAAFLAGSIHQT
jgi:hypothetical protein